MENTPGKLVMMEYKTTKYDRETRSSAPCTPHYVFKFELPDGNNVYVRQYDTPKTQRFLSQFKEQTGLGVGMDMLGQAFELYEKADPSGKYKPSWNVSTRPSRPNAPPSYPPQSAGPQADSLQGFSNDEFDSIPY